MFLLNKEKLHGLSILRMLSMFGIIALHVMNVGGAFDKTSLMSVYQLPVSILYILCSSSVNIFAMLTGYLYVDKPAVKYKNILKLIFIVLVYSVCITAFFLIFKPAVFNSSMDILKALFPPLDGKLWYITCYVLLFVLIPFLNKLINVLSIAQFKILLILLVIFTSVLPTFLLTDFFRLSEGYSTAWLVVCYLIGAYIKHRNIKTSARKLSVIYLLCVTAIMLSTAIVWFAFKKLAVYMFLTRYISPFMVIMSVISIMLFSRINVKNKGLIKVITSLSNSSFDAYILHSHILIYDFIITGNFVFVKNLHPVLIIPAILGSIIGIYVISWFICQIRSFGFKIARVDKAFDYLGSKIDSILSKD